MRRTQIMSNIRPCARVMEKAAVRLDCLDHPTPAADLAVAERSRAAKTRTLRAAIKDMHRYLAELEATLGS